MLGVLVGGAAAQTIRPAPDRPAGEGEGPFERLILRGVTVIDGTGAPPQGPVDIVIARNRIVEVRSVGYPGLPDPSRRASGRRHPGDRRHRPLRDARLRRLPRPHRRRPQGAGRRVRLQAVAGARRHDGPRRAGRPARLDAARARPQRPQRDHRAADRRLRPAGHRRRLARRAGHHAREGARMGRPGSPARAPTGSSCSPRIPR